MYLEREVNTSKGGIFAGITNVQNKVFPLGSCREEPQTQPSKQLGGRLEKKHPNPHGYLHYKPYYPSRIFNVSAIFQAIEKLGRKPVIKKETLPHFPIVPINRVSTPE